jgi:UDP-glucose 4-epimerase
MAARVCKVGEGVSVAEVIKVAAQVTAQTVPADICPRRPGDPAILVSDSSKAREQLGWHPKFSGAR